MKELGKQWRAEPPDVKMQYEELAATELARRLAACEDQKEADEVAEQLADEDDQTDEASGWA